MLLLAIKTAFHYICSKCKDGKAEFDQKQKKRNVCTKMKGKLHLQKI